MFDVCVWKTVYMITLVDKLYNTNVGIKWKVIFKKKQWREK